MRSTTTLLQALLASSALAIEITHPRKNDVVDLSKGVQVSWSIVSTDPTSAHLFLVNMAGGHTPYSKDLGVVDLTKGSVIIEESDVPNDTAYQVNFQSVTTGSTGILAQSEQFENKNSETSDDKTTTSKADSKTSAVTTLVTASESAAATTSASDSEESTAVTVSGASTLATVTSGSATGSATASRTASGTASGTASVTAAPTGAAAKTVQSGSLLALAVGLVAVLA